MTCVLHHKCTYAPLPADAISFCSVALPEGCAGREAAVHLAKIARSRKKLFKEQNPGCLMSMVPVMHHRHYDATMATPKRVESFSVHEGHLLV